MELDITNKHPAIWLVPFKPTGTEDETWHNSVAWTFGTPASNGCDLLPGRTWVGVPEVCWFWLGISPVKGSRICVCLKMACAPNSWLFTWENYDSSVDLEVHHFQWNPYDVSNCCRIGGRSLPSMKNSRDFFGGLSCSGDMIDIVQTHAMRTVDRFSQSLKDWWLDDHWSK